MGWVPDGRTGFTEADVLQKVAKATKKNGRATEPRGFNHGFAPMATDFELGGDRGNGEKRSTTKNSKIAETRLVWAADGADFTDKNFLPKATANGGDGGVAAGR